MHNEAARSLLRQAERLGKLRSALTFGDCETTGALAVFGALFESGDAGGDGRMRMTEVSRRLDVSKPAATQMINRLVERDLVERVNDENDRRVVCVQATQHGREVFAEGLEKYLDLADRVVERMGEEETKMLCSLLTRLFDALDEETEEKEC